MIFDGYVEHVGVPAITIVLIWSMYVLIEALLLFTVSRTGKKLDQTDKKIWEWAKYSSMFVALVFGIMGGGFLITEVS